MCKYLLRHAMKIITLKLHIKNITFNNVLNVLTTMWNVLPISHYVEPGTFTGIRHVYSTDRNTIAVLHRPPAYITTDITHRVE